MVIELLRTCPIYTDICEYGGAPHVPEKLPVHTYTTLVTVIFYGLNSAMPYSQTSIHDLFFNNMLILDIFKSVAWQEMEVIKDPELLELLNCCLLSFLETELHQF